MKYIKFMAFVLVLITVVLTLSSCGIKFHFIKDPCKLNWYINYYYKPTDVVDENGDVVYTRYSNEATFLNPLRTVNIGDTTLNFGEDNTVTFVDLNGITHNGTYDIEKYSREYYDKIVMNFDDGTSINPDYFKLKRDGEKNSYIVFVYDNVEYVFSTIPGLNEQEIAQRKYEMAEWARRLYEGYELTSEEKEMDFFKQKSVWLGGYPEKYRNYTQGIAIYISTITKRANGDFYCNSWSTSSQFDFIMDDEHNYVYVLIDKDNNMIQIEEPIKGKCLTTHHSPIHCFFFFE